MAHIVRSYDAELETIRRALSEMGELAEAMLGDATNALAKPDLEVAGRVVSTDARVDQLQPQVEEAAVLTIAKRQPVAVDLRECIAAIRIASDLERIGDLARNLARRATILSTGSMLHLACATTGLRTMQRLAAWQLKTVLDAYLGRDTERAETVWANDARLDLLEDATIRDLLTLIMDDPRRITSCTHLLFCVKNLERIGEHATNIAETVVYFVSGRALPSDRPKGPGR